MPGSALGLAVDDGRAYVAADYEGGLRVVDVVTPSAPAELGSSTAYGKAYDVVVVGDHAYLAFWNGLEIFDVGDPAGPTPTGACWTPDWCCGVEVVGSYAYLPCDTANFRAIDVSDPSNPFEVGSVWAGGRCWGVDVVGDHAYVATNGGLGIVDVQDPSNMSLVTVLPLDGWCGQVSVVGDLAYVTGGGTFYGGERVLYVVGVTDPASPQLLGRCELPDVPGGLVVDGTTVYVADGGQGVQVVDASDPAAPVVIRTFFTPGRANDVALDGGYLYVADTSGGLAVIDSAALPMGEASYSYEIDQASDTTADESAEGATPVASFTDLADGTWWFHVRAVNSDGEWGPTQHYQLNIDHRPHITSLWSDTHGWGNWTADNDPRFAYLTDVSCDAYSYAIDQIDGQEPDAAPDPVSDVDHPSVAFTDVPDGVWWFHVRARDLEGNWGAIAAVLGRDQDPRAGDDRSRGQVDQAERARAAVLGARHHQLVLPAREYRDQERLGHDGPDHRLRLP